MQHILTIDLEEWFHGLSEHGVSQVGNPGRLERPLNQLLDLLDEHAVRATFFWLDACVEPYGTVLRDAHKRGHEIASHGYRHTRIHRLTPRPQNVRRAAGA